MRDGELFRGVFCFEGFEVDVRSGELRKLGTRIKFQDQPLRLLTLLIEHQGEVVTREELRAKLWPADTFVDFDHGLNSAVARVREVLNDSAATPRFIETIPKRGYRFLAPVEVRGALPELRVAAITSSSEEKSDPVKDWNQWLGWLVVIGCLLAVIVFAGMEMVRPKAFAPPKIARTVQLTNDGQLKGTSASDGIRLYFVEKIAEKFLLKQVSVHGGVVSTVNPSWGPIYIYELSPNRSELLAGAEIKLEATPLFTIELPSGLPHKLNPWANAACWMRDGLHIAYAQGKEIYQASIDGSNANRIATVGGDVSNLSASPDGARLRFTTSDNESGALELTELSLKDGTVTSLTPSWKGVARPCCGVWSPDGRYYYFQTRLESKYLDGDIWVLPGASGKGQRIAETALTHGPLALGKLSVDPNGRTLYARGMLPRAQLVRYDSCSASLLPFLGGISASDVDISKDRQWVTYVSYPESVLWRSRLDGSEQLRLSFGKIEAYMPRWSPDGKEIAFIDFQEGKQSKILLVSKDGGPTRELLPEDRHWEDQVNWTSDGKSIVFQGKYLNDEVAIYRFDFGTRKVTQLPESKGLTWPRVSPDQRYVAAVSANLRKLLLFDNNTKKWSEISQVESGWIAYDNFSFDGKYIFMAGLDTQRGYRVLKVSVPKGKTTLVADLRNVAMPDPLWMGLAADDSPVIRIDKSTREIYAMELEFP